MSSCLLSRSTQALDLSDSSCSTADETDEGIMDVIVSPWSCRGFTQRAVGEDK